MKKKSLILLLAGVCLLSVGCGKEKDEEKESKKDSSVKTLTCEKEAGGEKMTMVIKQDQKTYKFTELSVVMEAPESSVKEMGIKPEEYDTMFCSDEEFKKCSVIVKGENIVLEAEYDTDAYEKELLEDENYGKLDGDTLNKLKEETEKDGATCTLS